MRPRSKVLEHAAAAPPDALLHYRDRLSFEADCADVYADLRAGITGFTVIDTRSESQYTLGHLPGSINIPHRRLSDATLIECGIPPTDLLVTYCAGPHCNASTRGALRLSELGREVKEMPGGLSGWVAEGLPVARGATPSSLHDPGVSDG